MPEFARKIEQPIETEEQRNRETGKHKNGETEETRKEAVKERKQREYEEFWRKYEKEYTEKGSNLVWGVEWRKGYVEQATEFLVDAHDNDVQTMVFMDKSARPLAGFFRALWKRLYPDEVVPEMRFFVSDWQRVGNSSPIATPEQVRKAFRGYEEIFNDKNVLVVDEYILFGTTINRAKQALQGAFPAIRSIMRGGMYEHQYTKEEPVSLDIKQPEGSYYTKLHEMWPLGKLLWKSGSEVEEVPGQVFTKAKRATDEEKARGKFLTPKTTSYPLRQVGKHETLDEKSIKGIDDRIEKAENEEERERLLKIREAYEKLL